VTRSRNARIAGFTFLFYIAVAFPDMLLSDRATRGADVAARLASVAHHVTDMRLDVVLTLLSCLSALVLAATLYAVTRDEDADLAMLGLICRVAEGVVGATGLPATLVLLWLATATGTTAPDAVTAQALGTLLFGVLGWNSTVAATFFAVGSTMFSWLLLRGRMVPVALAGLGVVASVLAVIVLPLQLAGWLRGPVTSLVWLPMLAFEVPLGLWLLVRGVAAPLAARIDPSLTVRAS